MTLLLIDWTGLAATIGQFVLSFSILVVLHEMGHFLPAKWFGCRVDKFYLFFDPWFSLFKIKKGATEYGLGWVPLGGYVKIAGMIDESMDKEQLKLPAQPYEFRSKPAWQRLIIMLGGVTVNFILAMLIFAMILFVWGRERMPVSKMKYGLRVDSLVQTAGLRNGDQVKAINNEPVNYLDDILAGIVYNEKVVFTINRNGKDTTVALPHGFLSNLSKAERNYFIQPRILPIIESDSLVKYVSGKLQKGDVVVSANGKPIRFFDEFADIIKKMPKQNIAVQTLRNSDTITSVIKSDSTSHTYISFKSYDELLGTEKTSYSFLQSIPAGISFGIDRLGDYITGIKLLFTSKEHKVNDNLGSIPSIAKTFGPVWDWRRFWTMTALFSIILAFMNILPIPALDGGHALFTLYEMITGRKPGDKFLEYAQMAGMALLLSLMVYAFGLDIWRMFFR